MRPNIVQSVDDTFWLIIGVSVILLLIVVVAMFIFIYKYNQKRHPVAEQISGHTGLEITWTVLPLILVIYLFFVGWNGFKNMRNVPADADSITVTGQMWKWSFKYQNGKTSDTLFVPHGKNIHMLIKSIDVNHSFYIVSHRVKEDAVPGRTNYLWFQTDKLGTYDISCAEYCGLNHWNMYAKLIIMPPDKFYNWYNTPGDTASKLASPDSLIKVDTTGTTTGIQTPRSMTDTTKPRIQNDSLLKK